MEGQYAVMAYSPEGIGTIMAVSQSAKQASKLADILLRDGYGTVEIKKMNEVKDNESTT